MSKTHPVVFSFGGAEHHLTFDEAGSAVGRLNAAITAAMMVRDRESRAMREALEAKAREEAPPVDRSRRCTVGEAVWEYGAARGWVERHDPPNYPIGHVHQYLRFPERCIQECFCGHIVTDEDLRVRRGRPGG